MYVEMTSMLNNDLNTSEDSWHGRCLNRNRRSAIRNKKQCWLDQSTVYVQLTSLLTTLDGADSSPSSYVEGYWVATSKSSSSSSFMNGGWFVTSKSSSSALSICTFEFGKSWFDYNQKLGKNKNKDKNKTYMSTRFILTTIRHTFTIMERTWDFI